MAEQLRHIFNRHAVEEIAKRVSTHCRAFKRAHFLREVCPDLKPLGLKDRSLRIARALRDHLPRDYPAALQILLNCLHDDGAGGVEGLHAFRFLPLLNFVGAYGLEHPGLSIPALAKMTRAFSAEFDIRPYLLRYPDATLAHVRAWARDPDWRVRRLASEGTRPRLPWGLRLHAFIADPSLTLQILEFLKDDPNEIVRRSVANHLNDIAKDHPAVVIDTARRWMQDATPNTRGIVRHALRTLVKQGNPHALAILGFGGASNLSVTRLRLKRSSIRLGHALEFSFTLTSNRREIVQTCIDYRIHHLRANGAHTPKTFKLASRSIAPGESIQITKTHPIVPITTRKYYSGLHRLELLINGRGMHIAEFTLNANPPRRLAR